MAEPAKKKGVHWAVQAWVLLHLFLVFSWTVPDPPERITRQAGFQTSAEIEQGAEPQTAPKPSFAQTVKDAPNYYLLYNRLWIKNADPARYYMGFSGFWQAWNMFSPNPANVDVYIDAIVEFQNGEVMQFKYPVMQELSLTERYFKERYRKFVENTHPEAYSYKWPPIAQRVAYLSYRGDGNFPTMVTLRRHFKTIPPTNPIPPVEGYTAPEYVTYPFFTYMVDIKKLQGQVR
jgi:hypothetical protein